MTLEEELGELRTTAWHQKPEIADDATQAKSEVIEEGIISGGGNEDGCARRAVDTRKRGI